MSKIVCNISTSADGFSAGIDQSEERPFGDADETLLHGWMFDTPEENRAELDAILDAKAFIMGRNMFGPIRGEWSRDWNGWWGPEPPYHAPVFVLTHHPRDPLVMEGGTTFHFVTDGIERALERAKESAGGKDVRLWGGAQVIQQYLAAGLLDELELHIAPVLLGDGERIFDNLGGAEIRLEQVRAVEAPGVTHLKYKVLK